MKIPYFSINRCYSLKMPMSKYLETKEVDFFFIKGQDWKQFLTLYTIDNKPLCLNEVSITFTASMFLNRTQILAIDCIMPNDPNSGKVILSCPKERFASMDPGRYEYELTLVDAIEKTHKVLHGNILIYPENK